MEAHLKVGTEGESSALGPFDEYVVEARDSEQIINTEMEHDNEVPENSLAISPLEELHSSSRGGKSWKRRQLAKHVGKRTISKPLL